MRMLRSAPPVDLAPWVHELTAVETDVEVTRTLVPDGQLTLGFRYRGHATLVEGERATRLPDAVVSGMRTTAREMRTAAGGGILLVCFRPGGASALLPQPLHELFGTHAALDALVDPWAVRDAAERIATATSHGQRLGALVAFLRALARARTAARDPLVGAAVRSIAADPAGTRIAALATALDVGQDALEKRFRRVVGATPKQLASILRLRRAVDAHRPGTPLTTLAHDAGFADQSHFVRSLKASTGTAPRRFFADARWC